MSALFAASNGRSVQSVASAYQRYSAFSLAKAFPPVEGDPETTSDLLANTNSDTVYLNLSYDDDGHQFAESIKATEAAGLIGQACGGGMGGPALIAIGPHNEEISQAGGDPYNGTQASDSVNCAPISPAFSESDTVSVPINGGVLFSDGTFLNTTAPYAVRALPIPAGVGAIASMVADSAGNVWLADSYDDAVWRVDAQGEATKFAVPAPGLDDQLPTQIINAADGGFWLYAPSVLFHLTQAGVFTSFALPANFHVQGIAVGRDGAVYATAQISGSATSSVLARIGTNGVVTSVNIPQTSPSNDFVTNIVATGTHALWFSTYGGGGTDGDPSFATLYELR